MDNVLAINLVLDSCAILILMLMLLPVFMRRLLVEVNHHKSNLLTYAIAVHYYVLFINLTQTISMMVSNAAQVAEVCGVVSSIFMAISALIMMLDLFCDEKGNMRIPKGRDIPVGQIVCMILPPTLAICLMLFFPKLHLISISWSVSLVLIYLLISIDSEKRLLEAERRIGLAQATRMANQMQPHFIFNTLSAIKSLCQIDPQSAEDAIDNLSGYLRGNIEALSAEGLISFDTEMRHILEFIALEQADPTHKFAFEYELDVRDFSIPPLTVQPIVENAVKYGALSHHDGRGKVLLTTEEIGMFIRIIVTDNGEENDDLTRSQKETSGIGIINTEKRLRELCDGSLKITSGEQGTQAVIMIPKGR